METQALKTQLTNYNFDVRNADEKAAYAVLTKQLKREGLRLFDVHEFQAKGRITESQTVELETKHLFNNQWNTTDGRRIFDWFEVIYPNRNLKKGYYLTQTAEMRDIRSSTYQCGYCGKQYHNPEEGKTLCLACIGSEYLTPEYFPLLRLHAIDKDTPKAKRQKLTDQELQLITSLYELEHAKTMQAKVDKRIQAKRDAIIKSRQALDEEERILDWCIKHSVFNKTDVSNFVYYGHTKTALFGWRTSEKDNAQLREKLKNAPFKWEIK